MRIFDKDHTVDRSTWKSGPWDNEPDYHEWTTRAGYPAYIGRLDSGAWAGSVIAPGPPGEKGWEKMKFYHKLEYIGWDKNAEFSTGHSSYTDVEGILEYCGSAEHWESPGPSKRIWWRGPYKTMDEFKERCENLASALLKLHNDPSLYEDF